MFITQAKKEKVRVIKELLNQKIKQNIILKLHLIISIAVVIPAGFMYGFISNFLLEISPETTDEHNFQNAIMGLYLGFSVLWLMGVFKKYLLKTALISNMVFMLGLGLGRLISFLGDGLPSALYLYGTFAELLLGFYGIWVLHRYKKEIH